MSAEVRKFDEAVASLTAPGQPFAVETIDIGAYQYLNYTEMPANLGQYFLNMQRQGDKDFAVYLNERYTYGQAYQHSTAFAAALVGECWTWREAARLLLYARAPRSELRGDWRALVARSDSSPAEAPSRAR